MSVEIAQLYLHIR